MTTAAEQKAYWNYGEVVMWICTRDHDRVAELRHMREAKAIIRAVFGSKSGWELWWARTDAGPELEARRFEAPLMMRPDEANEVLSRKVLSGRLGMMMIRYDGDDHGRTGVSLSEANDFEFRLTGDPDEPVIVWSRALQKQVGTSPWFLRRDVLRLWPEWVTRTVTLMAAIRGYVEEISTPEAPLTKAEARERCLREVPGARPRAFERAWARVDPARKRGRGKHGPPRH
jgi:hypothetical protein